MLLFTDVDISDFVLSIFGELLSVLEQCVWLLDSIIIFDGSDFGLDFYATLFDFSIGLVVVSIVIGAFVHVNKADNFYSNKKD